LCKNNRLLSPGTQDDHHCYQCNKCKEYQVDYNHQCSQCKGCKQYYNVHSTHKCVEECNFCEQHIVRSHKQKHDLHKCMSDREALGYLIKKTNSLEKRISGLGKNFAD